MATFKYGNALQQFGTGQFNWPAMTVKALLLSAAYVPRPNTDIYVSDIPASAIIVRSASMISLSMVFGLAKGIIPTFNAFLSVVPVAAVALYADTGVDSTSQLLYYSSDGVGFPFTPQGFNYAVAQDLAQGGWFQV